MHRESLAIDLHCPDMCVCILELVSLTVTLRWPWIMLILMP